MYRNSTSVRHQIYILINTALFIQSLVLPGARGVKDLPGTAIGSPVAPAQSPKLTVRTEGRGQRSWARTQIPNAPPGSSHLLHRRPGMGTWVMRVGGGCCASSEMSWDRAQSRMDPRRSSGGGWELPWQGEHVMGDRSPVLGEVTGPKSAPASHHPGGLPSFRNRAWDPSWGSG